MAYANTSNYKQVSFYYKFKSKIGKILAQYAPYYKMRIFGMKLCGFYVGSQTYIGQDLIIASLISEKSCHLKIGDRVALGPRVTIILSSDANWSNLMKHIEPIKGTVILKNDCWIGAGAIILPNVSIGECSIVGAGSVVTKDVPDFTVVAGVPAVVIKKLNIS
ncbi:acyltransferase [Aquipluma nitroreducens]|nr:acyltransferase [Aquipluma nitroreducens]